MKSRRVALAGIGALAAFGGATTAIAHVMTADDQQHAIEEGPPPKRPDLSSVRVTVDKTPAGKALGLRRFTTSDGEICFQVGVTANGKIGAWTEKGFKDVPLEEGGVCGDGRPFVAVTSEPTDDITDPDAAGVTTVYGMVPPGSKAVTVNRRGDVFKVQPDEQGVFFEAVDGIDPTTEQEPRSASVGPEVTWRSPKTNSLSRVNSLGQDIKE